MTSENREKIITEIFYAALDVHKEMGPGLLESIYEECLYIEITNRGLKCERQKEMFVVYKGKNLEQKFKLDLIVEDEIIIELKTVEHILDVHYAQLMTYMKIKAKPLGVLINFNVDLLKNGFKRRIINI